MGRLIRSVAVAWRSAAESEICLSISISANFSPGSSSTFHVVPTRHSVTMRSPFTILFLFISFILHVSGQLVIEEIEPLEDDDPRVSGFVPASGPRTNLSVVYVPLSTQLRRTQLWLYMVGYANVGSFDTTFPESQNPKVGMFYNGRTSRVDIAISNAEKEPIIVHFIGGQFQDLATLKPVFNVLRHLPPTTSTRLRTLLTMVL
jgi:hypothetical protein